jgi:V/A-type H+-transporting ATPase subunit I
MFGALPMQHVTLFLLNDELPRASLLLAQLGILDPNGSESRHAGESPVARYQQLHADARQLFHKIVATLGNGDLLDAGTLPREVDRQRLEQLRERLQPIWQDCNRYEEQVRRQRDGIRQLEQQKRAVDSFLKLRLDLQTFSGDHGFLDMRVGSVESSQLQRLRESLGLIRFKVIEFDRQDDRVHLVLLGLGGLDEQLEPVLRAAGYRTLLVPEGLSGYPEELHADLVEQLAAGERQLDAFEKERQALRDRYAPILHEAAVVLDASAPLADVADHLVGHGQFVTLAGWVPRKDLPRLDERLGNELTAWFREEREPRPDEIDRVPSVQEFPALLRPFSLLVRNFGTPRYDEFDPTLLFAVTFILMFGSMFGDVGHGAVILLAGWYFRRRIGDFFWLSLLAGLSSIAFGFLYGSVFGSEEVLQPLWMSPMHDPVRLLLLAVYWGFGFIVVVTLLSIFNFIRLGLRSQALLHQRGLAGLLFYIGLVLYVAGLNNDAIPGQLAIALILIGAAGVIAGLWRASESRGGERLLIVLIEMAETLTGYFSNTVSFLRVAAFALNHAALAFAVFTVAGMMDTAGHWITLLIGNLIMIVLEGGIVLIQVLRLEYYEGFVRFFRGDGRAYRPLRLEASVSGSAG